MKAGALDFIEKPIGREELIASIERALELSREFQQTARSCENSAAAHLAGLTPRQREVMERVLAGQPSKNIAADLGISQRTVENHRASHHEKNRVEVAARAGPIGGSRVGETREDATGELRERTQRYPDRASTACASCGRNRAQISTAARSAPDFLKRGTSEKAKRKNYSRSR